MTDTTGSTDRTAHLLALMSKVMTRSTLAMSREWMPSTTPK
jgi:hypothetical protein